MKFLSKDNVVSGKLARALATIDGSVEELFYAKKLETKMEVTKKDIAILGKVNKETKETGAKYTGTMTIYYLTSKFRRLMLKYAKTGVFTDFDLLIENEDPSTKIGKQVILLKGVSIDGMTLAKFDIDSDDPLEEEVSFTFSDWDILEDFKDL